MRRGFLVVLALALAVAGGFLFWDNRPKEAPPLPMPDHEIQVAHAEPTGPTTAVVDDGFEMSPVDMEPGTLFIPSVGAYSKVVDAGLDRGMLDIPNDPRVLGRWVKGAPLVAGTGQTLVSGHVTWNADHGSLYHLADIKAGERAWTKGADGKMQEFVLVGLRSYVKAELPKEVWQAQGDRKLTVVTCGGPVERGRGGRHYRDNLVATFIPVGG